MKQPPEHYMQVAALSKRTTLTHTELAARCGVGYHTVARAINAVEKWEAHCARKGVRARASAAQVMPEAAACRYGVRRAGATARHCAGRKTACRCVPLQNPNREKY